MESSYTDSSDTNYEVSDAFYPEDVFENCVHAIPCFHSGLNRPISCPCATFDYNASLTTPYVASPMHSMFMISESASTGISHSDSQIAKNQALQWDSDCKNWSADCDSAPRSSFSSSGMPESTPLQPEEAHCYQARRTKFTAEDDRLITYLRESGRTWKEIAKTLPGRSPGALQVRYSTKLKAKMPDKASNLVCTSDGVMPVCT